MKIIFDSSYLESFDEQGGKEKIRRTKPKKGLDKSKEKDRKDYSQQREKKRNWE